MVPADQRPAEFALRPRGEEAPKALLRGEALPDEVNKKKGTSVVGISACMERKIFVWVGVCDQIDGLPKIQLVFGLLAPHRGSVTYNLCCWSRDFVYLYTRARAAL